jgi:hypothetical protein
MPNFNWKERTGISEMQWLQMLVAIFSACSVYFELPELALHSSILANFLLGGIGYYLRRKDKKNVN